MGSVDEKHPIRPFLRWAGSKRQLLPVLSNYWESTNKRYAEPFMGSACLFFRLRPNRSILSDINPELVATFKAIQADPMEVAYLLKLLRPSKERYLELRKEELGAYTQSERAARFIYLNRHCFNGLYRTNLKGEFNVPYAPLKAGAVPELAHLESCSEALQGAELLVCDFQHTLAQLKKGDFVYLDPPFAIDEARMFMEYGVNKDSKVSFQSSDLARLASELNRLNKKGVKFLVSYADTPSARVAFSSWHLRNVSTRRNIAGGSKFRGLDAELLVTNMEATCQPTLN